MGFLQNLAKKAEEIIKSASENTGGDKIVLSYLGQTTEIPADEIEESDTVGALIRDMGPDFGLPADFNLSAVGVRKDGTVVGLNDKPTAGTYFVTLAREEKAVS